MMETILSWFSTAIGNTLEFLIGIFLSSLKLDVNEFLVVFPVAMIGYKIFQAIGVGLTLCIALVELFRFFGGRVTQSSEPPTYVAIKAAASCALIYFGGYILTLIVDLAKTPYDAMQNVNAVSALGPFEATVDLMKNVATLNFTDSVYGTDIAAAVAGRYVVEMVSVVLLLMLGWNLLKLVLEICERYVMVGVLTYSSPLIYPTITSKETSNIFKSWVSMFVGQNILMLISVWSFKLILSAFTYAGQDGTSGEDFFLRLLLAFAMCKIAQNMDSYMQQLGIGVVRTGGSLVEEIMTTGRALSRMAGGDSKSAGNSKLSVLGAGVGGKNSGAASNFGGLFGGAANAVKSGISAAKEGRPEDIAKDMSKGFAEGAFKGSVPGRIVAQGIAAAQRPTAAQRAEQAANANAAFAERAKAYRGNPTNKQTMQDKLRADGITAQQRSQFMFGGKNPGSVFYDAENHEVNLDKDAVAAGLQIARGPGGSEQIMGSDSALANHIAANYQYAGQEAGTDDGSYYESMLCQSAKNGPQCMAEAALADPNQDLYGNDELGKPLIHNAFGQSLDGIQLSGADANIQSMYSGLGHADFTNIQAQTGDFYADTNGNMQGGGRVISADYTSASGKPCNMEIHDAVSYWGMPANERATLQEITTPTNQSYYVRAKESSCETWWVDKSQQKNFDTTAKYMRDKYSGRRNSDSK